MTNPARFVTLHQAGDIPTQNLIEQETVKILNIVYQQGKSCKIFANATYFMEFAKQIRPIIKNNQQAKRLVLDTLAAMLEDDGTDSFTSIKNTLVSIFTI